MSEISGVFEVNASHTFDAQADVDGLTHDEIAELVYQLDPGISICHQCAHDINDPEPGELVAFVVDGVEYVRSQDGRSWVTEGGRG